MRALQRGERESAIACIDTNGAGFGKGGGVLQNKDAMATVAVKDIKAAAKFYEGTLGLKIIEGPEPSVRSYKAGSSTLLVYESQFARTNKATAVTWTLGADLEGIVRG